jgi:hypothetical protein
MMDKVDDYAVVFFRMTQKARPLQRKRTGPERRNNS